MYFIVKKIIYFFIKIEDKVIMDKKKKEVVIKVED